MQVKLFTIPIGDSGAAEEEMNRFMRANRVLDVTHHFVSVAEKGCFWCFCVRYIENGLATVPATSFRGGGRGKVDYREVLSPEVFAVFARLRECRKQIASAEGLPAYAVFTDEELAGIASLPELTVKKLREVPGIGEKKATRFGQPILDMLQTGELSSGETVTQDEA